jgi:hypothetical protein
MCLCPESIALATEQQWDQGLTDTSQQSLCVLALTHSTRVRVHEGQNVHGRFLWSDDFWMQNCANRRNAARIILLRAAQTAERPHSFSISYRQVKTAQKTRVETSIFRERLT